MRDRGLCVLLLTQDFCLEHDGVAGVAAALYARFGLHRAPSDRLLLVIAVTIMGAVQLVTLGIIGGYLALAYDEARARPLYIVREKTGFDGEGGGGPSGQNR